MPKPFHCTKCQILLNQIQPYTVIWISMTRTDGINGPNRVGHAEKKSKSDLLDNAKGTQHTVLLHIECRVQYYFAALKQTTF